MKKQEARISARLTAQERQRVEQLIAEGKFKNLTDFLRIAISRLLETA
jgi:Arc/MetJ-type ribon-helix-helix transcriptional regulator